MALKQQDDHLTLMLILANPQHALSVYSETFFGWMNLKARKLVVPPTEIQDSMLSLSKADNYHVLPDDMSLKNPKIPFGKTPSPTI